MTKLSLVLVAALSFAALGCKKKGADCDNAIHNSMKVSKSDLQKAPGMDSKTMQKMTDIGIQHCKDDKWSADAIKCMVDAKDEATAQGCYGKLSADQQQKMNDAVMGAMGGGAGAGGSAAATGSDMGSAAAGSAK
jgi:hypothetical protein